MVTARRARFGSCVFLAALAAGVGVAPTSTAGAAAGLGLSKDASGQVRAGQAITYTLTASNTGSSNEFNLSFRDVLPDGVTYVAGSTTPTQAGEPEAVAGPGPGETTLIWADVADVAPVGSFALSFRAMPDTTMFPVGSTVTNPGAQLYANTDPRTTPQFDSTGAIVPGTATETAASGSATTLISALQLTKTEPSPEGELLRGVHDQTTVYTLTVRGTDVAETDGLDLVDYIPADIEFLGCGGVDNSSGREYPGAPSLTATPRPANCVTPISVSTVQNPPPTGGTTYPPGIYTRVEWSLGDLAPGATRTVSYAAGIPLHANALWPDTEPDPSGLTQTANLDNNTGPSTRETATEASATNIATVEGTYTGPLADGASPDIFASASKTVSVEDMRMRKSVSPATFHAGTDATYTLTIDTSEYASGSFTITDTLPSGVCPLGGPGTNFATGAPAACDGSAATVPSDPYQSVTENADGSFTVVFQPLSLPLNGTATITYKAAMLSTYLAGPRAGEPTATGDSFTNHAVLAGTTTPRPGTGETGSQAVGDESSATQTTGGPAIVKTLLPRPATTGGPCPTDTAAYGNPATLPPADSQFRSGDVVCFALEADFPGTTQTRNPNVFDFLPPGLVEVPGSVRVADNDTGVPFTLDEASDSLLFTLGAQQGATRFVGQGAIFAVVFQARVTTSTATPTGEARPNRMKMTIQNANGTTASFRSSAAVTVVAPPPLGVVKGIEAIDSPAAGPFGPDSNIDGREVHAGSVVTFRIDITNQGSGSTAYPVGGVDVWDVLPGGITCADVSNVRGDPGLPAPTVACTNPGDPGQPSFAGSGTLSLLRVTYPLDPSSPAQIAPGDRMSTLYDVTIPTPARVANTYTDTAYVRSYNALTDVPGTTTTYFPKQNIDSTVPPADQLAPPASDPSNVFTPSASVAKTGTTSITETGNDTATQATIGELVTYTYSVTVPAHTSAFSGVLTDLLPTGFTIQPPAVLEFLPDAGSPGTAPVPAGVTIDPATGQVTFPDTYTNSTATDQQFRVTLVTQVTSAALPLGQNDLTATNTARFTSLIAPGGSALPPVSATYSVTLIQPDPELEKSNSDPSVNGGATVTFTLTATNPGSDRPPLHDAFLTDCVPDGLAFQAYGPNPGRPPTAGDGTNDCATGTTRLVWQLGTVNPGATVVRTYTAVVPLDAVGGTTYTNTALLTGSTLDDGKTDPLAPDNPAERAYAVTASSDVTVQGAASRKSVDPDHATIGESETWQIEITIPPNTRFFDGALLDTIPPGLTSIQLQSIECTILSSPAQSCTLSATPLKSVVQPDGSVLHGWDVGDVPAIADPRDVLLTYTSKVADVPVNVAGRPITNTAQVAWNVTNGKNPISADFPFDRTGPLSSATLTVVEPNVTLSKAVAPSKPGPTDPFTYTLTLTNSNGANTSAAYEGKITDVVPKGVVVDPSSISSGGTISGANPVTGGGTITWVDPAQGAPLDPGQTFRLTYRAVLAPSATLTGAALRNTATLVSYESLPTGGRVYAGNTASATVTPAFPRLTTVKAAVSPSPAYIGSPFTWRVTETNTGGAPAFSVDVVDTLPTGWTYTPGSATVSVAGGPAVAIEPVISGGIATWSNVGTLQPGKAAVVTFQATPTSSVVTNPGVGSNVAQTNTAVGAGEDATGATGNASGSYSAGPATAKTRIDSADVAVTKTHVVPVVAGSTARWTVTVTNKGADTAVGPFTVTDTLPGAVSFVSASGTGWSCSFAAGTITCTRTNPADTLTSGASFPGITILTAVPQDTPAGTPLTNLASVTARTFDPNLSNNTDGDTATVTASADLGIAKAHAAPIVPGQPVTWTIDVTNHGPSVAVALITVTDSLPAGTTYVSASGTGWSCTGSGRSATCTRATDLPPGPADEITLTADVAASATGSLDNTATVHSPTPDPVPGNNTAIDPGPLSPSADLALSKSHSGSFTAGTTGTYLFNVFNAGPSDAASPVRITDTLPSVLTYKSFSSVTGAWSCSASGQDVTCTLSGALAADSTAAVTIDVAVSPTAPPNPIVNTATVTSPTPDPILINNTDSDDTSVNTTSDLAVTKSHSGAAVAGAQFSWSVVVHNNGPSANPGPITLVDHLPSKVSFVSAAGTGWTCSATGQNILCTSPAALASGDDAPTVTVTGLIASNAGPATIVNSAAVFSATPDDVLSNNVAFDPTTVIDQADVAIAKTVDPASVPAGATTTYTLTATNNGPSDADAVTVADTMPAGVTPTSASGTGWSCVVRGQVVTCTRATLTAGVSSPITVAAVTSSGLASGTTLTNTALIATSTDSDLPGNNTATATLDITTSADLELTKTHLPLPGGVAHSGGEATFAIAVHNAGPSDAATPLTVTDTLPADLSFVSAEAPWTCSATGQVVTCTYSETDAILQGTAAPALLLTVEIDAAAPAGTYTNTATVSSPTPDPDTSNNTDTDGLPVTPSANVSITKTHAGPVRIGDPLTFHITAHNDGPSAAQDVVVTDTMPKGLTLVSATGTGWNCSITGDTLTCTLTGPLAPLTDSDPIDVATTVEASAYPEVRNTADISTSTDGDLPGDDTATDVVQVPPQVDLSITKTHTGAFVVGQRADWLLTVTNAGPTRDPGPLTVIDNLPVGVTFVSAEGVGWSCGAHGRVVTCRSQLGLAVEQVRRITVTVEVGANAYPQVVNTAAVTSPAEDLDPANNVATDAPAVDPVSALDIRKRLVHQDGRRATFGIDVTNDGPNTTTAPVVVTDHAPPGMRVISATGRNWACGVQQNIATCTYSDPLAPHQSAPSIQVVTELTAAAGATVVNVAVVSGGQPGHCPQCHDSDHASAVVPGGGSGPLPSIPSPGGVPGLGQIPGLPLPQTGVDVLLGLFAGAGLLAAGLAVRRRRRGSD